ncbi:prenyltransferase/squalene oxidase repeat-containing protein [Paenibacillus dendritiformis]|uniref:prenyltransferase/squalene oxidase repeat-containing protein n=1 Tax=Paenibacillus dendritiformis TaxID=130049 RepID=UPI000DA9C554|nr:hypothetical protein [Paenibacillus dendritiformis]PZM61887.1 hypothetical protein DOE73_30205 [Paenibacillus dendritiformis]
MKKRFILVFFILCLFLFFSKILLQSNEHFVSIVPSEKINEVLNEHYIQYGDLIGFRKSEEPNLYITYWSIKIYKLLNQPISDNKKENIIRKIEDMNIFNETMRDKVGLHGLPLEYVISMLIETYVNLEIPISDQLRTQVEEYYEKKLENEGLITNPAIIKWIISGYYLLKTELPEKEKIIKYLENLPKQNDTEFISYCYYRYLIDGKITEKSRQRLNEIKINFIKADVYYKTHYAYLLESLLKKIEVESAHHYDDKYLFLELGKLYNQQPIDIQFLYKMLFLNLDSISNTDKKGLIDFLDLHFYKNGWTNLGTLLDLNTSLYGIEILRRVGYISENDKMGINNYLDYSLRSLEASTNKLNFMSATQLRSLIEAAQLTNNNKLINRAKSFLGTQLEKALDNEDFDSIWFILTESCLLLNDPQLLKILKEKTRELSIDHPYIETLESLYLSIIFESLHQDVNKEKIMKRLHEFKKNDGGYGLYIQDVNSSLETTYLVIRLLNMLDTQLAFQDKVDLYNFLNKTLDDEGIEDIYTLGLYYKILNYLG